jgi:hypothetical protein
MRQFTPLELCSYFLVFQCHFSKPNFVYFQGIEILFISRNCVDAVLAAGGAKKKRRICGCTIERVPVMINP